MGKNSIMVSLAIPFIIIGMIIFFFLLIGYSYICFFPFIIKKGLDWYNNQLKNFQGIIKIYFSFLFRIMVFDTVYSHLIKILMNSNKNFEEAFNTAFSIAGNHNIYLQIFVIGFFFFTPIKNLFFYTLITFQNNKSKKYIILFIVGIFVIGLLAYSLLNSKAFPEKYATQIILYTGLTSLAILCSAVLIAIVIPIAYFIGHFQKKNN